MGAGFSDQLSDAFIGGVLNDPAAWRWEVVGIEFRILLGIALLLLEEFEVVELKFEEDVADDVEDG